jgi:hypothetical protein
VGTCTWKRMVVFSLFLIRHKVGNPWYCKLALGIYPQKKKQTSYVATGFLLPWNLLFVVRELKSSTIQYSSIQIGQKWLFEVLFQDIDFDFVNMGVVGQSGNDWSPQKLSLGWRLPWRNLTDSWRQCKQMVTIGTPGLVHSCLPIDHHIDVFLHTLNCSCIRV